jgi:hypothetical protein
VSVTLPPKSTQFSPGQSGNPSGYSRKRRVCDALTRLIGVDDKRADELALIVYAMATGQPAILKGRTPDLGWFRELRDMLGEQPERDHSDEEEPLDPMMAARIYAATNDGDDPTFGEPGPPAAEPPAGKQP